MCYIIKVKGVIMKLDYLTIKRMMMEKNMADGGYVAYGKNNQKFAIYMGGVIGALATADLKSHIVSMKDNKIVITPFTKNGIEFENAYGFEKEKIQSVKLSLFGTLKIFINGEKHEYAIEKGQKDVRMILEILGFAKKKNNKKQS